MAKGRFTKGTSKSEYNVNTEFVVTRDSEEHRNILKGKILAEIAGYDQDQLDALLTIIVMNDDKPSLVGLAESMM
jgi:hypothetical protein